MNIPAFFANIFPTLFLAFVGTSLSAAAVALLLHTAGTLGLCYPLSKLAALFFGSLISATDPVTVRRSPRSNPDPTQIQPAGFLTLRRTAPSVL